jgi:hypothetical protein
VIRYEPTRPDDGALRQRLRELAAERRRFGYRRLGYLLAREGIAPNHKKLLRIYREEGPTAFYRGLSASYLGVLETALHNDTAFLAHNDVMDYSLLVGVHNRRFRVDAASMLTS